MTRVSSDFFIVSLRGLETNEMRVEGKRGGDKLSSGSGSSSADHTRTR
jgi:hypothetical protein